MIHVAGGGGEWGGREVDKKQGTSRITPPLLWLLDSVPRNFQHNSFRKSPNVEVIMLFWLVRNGADGEGEVPRSWFPEGKTQTRTSFFFFFILNVPE